MARTASLDLTVVAKELENHGTPETSKAMLEFDALVQSGRFSWSSNIRLIRPIGSGGQGVVFLGERVGADAFQKSVAVKFFSPESYSSIDAYDISMQQLSRIASIVAQIRHHNLLIVDHFLNRDRIRIMVMDRVKGFDLRSLMTFQQYGRLEDRVSQKRWNSINQNLVTTGAVQPKLRPRVVVALLQDALNGLSALHECGVVHADMKPSNMMISSHGSLKLVDIGSAIEMDSDFESRNGCTPSYASVKILSGETPTVNSDLESLGYTMLELLLGRPLFNESADLENLIAAKTSLKNGLPNWVSNENDGVEENLFEFCQNLLNADESESAERLLADPLFQNADFESRSLMQVWIEELLELEGPN
ncbi:MAG: protein kinase [Planctomycetota bacterium]